MRISKTRRWRGCADERTWRVPSQGLLHSLLRKLTRRKFRHTALRHNEMHAFELQQALMFGLMERKKIPGESFYRYYITKTGRDAFKVLNEFRPSTSHCKTCKLRVRCLLPKGCLRPRLLVEIPIQPSLRWINYFDSKVW